MIGIYGLLGLDLKPGGKTQSRLRSGGMRETRVHAKPFIKSSKLVANPLPSYFFGGFGIKPP